ncbi:MAG: hypothetical protein H7232_01490 [Aeromicrobium sp.]|nr:hypothetical protein [Burkholderiales bacterium]
MNVEWTDTPQAPPPSTPLTAATGVHGPSLPPQQRLLTYSASEWESFIHEWAHYFLRRKYSEVQRYTGSGDLGLDVVGFTCQKRLQGVWDNYQCKHFDHAVQPAEVWVEIGKILWYSFSGHYAAPRRVYFVAPKGVGPSLNLLLGNATKLKEMVISNWPSHIATKITDTQVVPLTGLLRAHVDSFDFSIFSSKTGVKLVDDHRSTPYHAARFGGGLKARPATIVPTDQQSVENRFVSQLLAAYGQHAGSSFADPSKLSVPKLRQHFLRQREAFYSAETLRVFAREETPAGTFASFQNEIYHGVIDTHDAEHSDGYQKVLSVTKAARDMQITANVLITCQSVMDRDGICHQLVNDDRMWWSK